MASEVPHLGRIDVVPENAWTPEARADMDSKDFGGPASDHYLTNPILRASEVMAELSRLAGGRAQAMAAE